MRGGRCSIHITRRASEAERALAPLAWMPPHSVQTSARHRAKALANVRAEPVLIPFAASDDELACVPVLTKSVDSLFVADPEALSTHSLGLSGSRSPTHL